MHFLKTAFWVVVAVALALFTKANWTGVTVKLWGDLVLDTRLPVLIVLAFLLGLVPTWLWARAVKWSLQRKLSNAERALANTVPAVPANDTPAIAAPSPSPYSPSVSEPPKDP